jgi:heme-degrading monooxygenase HmoA
MLHAHNAEIIQKETKSFSVFNSEEPIRMWSEGDEFKKQGKKDTNKISTLILQLSVNSD